MTDTSNLVAAARHRALINQAEIDEQRGRELISHGDPVRGAEALEDALHARLAAYALEVQS